MSDRLFNHRCMNCGNSYLSPDKERIFCHTGCQDNFKKKKRGNHVWNLSEGERIEKNKISLQKLRENNKLKRESLPKKEKEYVDLKSLMYRDTFKEYIPKKLKVMRG